MSNIKSKENLVHIILTDDIFPSVNSAGDAPKSVSASQLADFGNEKYPRFSFPKVTTGNKAYYNVCAGTKLAIGTHDLTGFVFWEFTPILLDSAGGDIVSLIASLRGDGAGATVNYAWGLYDLGTVTADPATLGDVIATGSGSFLDNETGLKAIFTAQNYTIPNRACWLGFAVDAPMKFDGLAARGNVQGLQGGSNEPAIAYQMFVNSLTPPIKDDVLAVTAPIPPLTYMNLTLKYAEL